MPNAEKLRNAPEGEGWLLDTEWGRNEKGIFLFGRFTRDRRATQNIIIIHPHRHNKGKNNTNKNKQSTQ